MNIFKKPFEGKTDKQIFVKLLLIVIIVVIVICAILRLCGVMYLLADVDSIKTPNRFIQEIVKAVLLIFELTFTYKILCRAKWWICILVSVAEALVRIGIGFAFSSETIVNIFYLICYLAVPQIFNRGWLVLVDSIVMYLILLAYGAIFLLGRTGGIDINSGFSYAYNIVGMIDYKILPVAIYLYVKIYGGVKLWKNQKRLLFQKNLNNPEE